MTYTNRTEQKSSSNRDSIKFTFIVFGVVLSLISFIGGLMYGLPQYKVYTAEQEGKAILAKAQATKQAQIADAEAKFESAAYLKKAADEIQTSLSPEYIQYLTIQMMENVGEHSDNAVYLPVNQNLLIPATK